MRKFVVVIVVLLLAFSTAACTKSQEGKKSNGIDFSNVEYMHSETSKDQKLEEAITKVYNLKRGVDKIHYYYNRIDLDGDYNPETIVFLVGPSVSGTGGGSALIFKNYDGDYNLVSRFTLVHNPIFISENRTNGWKDIIMHVSGGGVDEFFAEMKFDGTGYPMNPSVQPKVKLGMKVQGTVIIADDTSKNQGIEY